MTNSPHIAILGAGQLGRMLALAGYPLGLRFRLLDPVSDAPAGQLAPQIVAAFDDPAALAQLAAGAQCSTYEFENIPVATARLLEQYAPVFPPPAALEVSQDRLREKQFFQQLGAQTPPFAAIDSHDELHTALEQLGPHAVLKTRRMGYDGKGQFVIRSAADTATAWATFSGQPLILEGFVDFRRELSIIAVRSRNGETACYPLTENHHHNGMLRRSIAPAPGVTAALQAEAENLAQRALAALGYVGVLAIELFEVRNDSQPALLVNEMAPRVHNSGHWTIEGAETSQFENHLRAITGLPLGATTARGASIMLNLIGAIPDPGALLAIPGLHLHTYAKQPRAGRKVGHVTLCNADEAVVAQRAAQVEALLASWSR